MRINFTFSCIAAYALISEQKTLVEATRLQQLAALDSELDSKLDSEPSEERPDAHMLPEADTKISATAETDAGTKLDAKSSTDTGAKADSEFAVLYRPLDLSLGGLATHVYESIFGPSLPAPLPLLPDPMAFGTPGPMVQPNPGFGFMQPQQQQQPLVNVYQAPQTFNPQYHMPPSQAYQSPFPQQQEPQKVVQPVVIQNQCPACKQQQPIAINVNYEKKGGLKKSQVGSTKDDLVKDDPFKDDFFKQDSTVKPVETQPVSPPQPQPQPQPQNQQTPPPVGNQALGPLSLNPDPQMKQQEPAQIGTYPIQGQGQQLQDNQALVSQQPAAATAFTGPAPSQNQVVQQPLIMGKSTVDAQTQEFGVYGNGYEDKGP